jgi:hypothetical protein
MTEIAAENTNHFVVMVTIMPSKIFQEMSFLLWPRVALRTEITGMVMFS